MEDQSICKKLINEDKILEIERNKFTGEIIGMEQKSLEVKITPIFYSNNMLKNTINLQCYTFTMIEKKLLLFHIIMLLTKYYFKCTITNKNNVHLCVLTY